MVSLTRHVAIAWIDDQLAWDAEMPEPAEYLYSMRHRYGRVELAPEQERRRLYVFEVSARRPVPKEFWNIIRVVNPLDLMHALRGRGLPGMDADPVGNTGDQNGGFESCVLSDGASGEIAT